MEFSRNKTADLSFNSRMSDVDTRFVDCPFCKKPGERMQYSDEPTFKHRQKMIGPKGMKFMKATYCKGSQV